MLGFCNSNPKIERFWTMNKLNNLSAENPFRSVQVCQPCLTHHNRKILIFRTVGEVKGCKSWVSGSGLNFIFEIRNFFSSFIGFVLCLASDLVGIIFFIPGNISVSIIQKVFNLKVCYLTYFCSKNSQKMVLDCKENRSIKVIISWV